MLWTYAGIVQPGADTVGRPSLTKIVLQDVSAGSMQDSRSTATESSRVLPGVNAATASLKPIQGDFWVVDKATEQPNGVAATTDTRYDCVRQSPATLQNLSACLATNDRLEVPHQLRERSRSGDGSQHVVRGVHIGDPVAHRLVDCILKRPSPGRHRHHLGPKDSHPGHVKCLSLGVLFPHVDRALDTHQRRSSGGRNAVLSGSGLGNHPFLAHPFRQQQLAEDVIDLVTTRVVEVLTLEEDRGTATFSGKPVYRGQRARSTDIVSVECVQLSLKLRVIASPFELMRQLIEGVHQRLGHKPAAIVAEFVRNAGWNSCSHSYNAIPHATGVHQPSPVHARLPADLPGSPATLRPVPRPLLRERR